MDSSDMESDKTKSISKSISKRIVVTPAGRARYLEILHKHLEKQREHFDQWLLLVNTNNVEDIGFCERLAARNDSWIDTRYAKDSDPNRQNLNIHKFLNQFCTDPDAVYLRLDDDVVYLAPDFVKTMFETRLADPEPYLVYGNIINNAITSWIHQKLGNFRFKNGHSLYDCVDHLGWANPEFAEELHREFLKNPTDPKWTSFEKWVATEYERISINAICFFGKDFASEPVADDEELFLSVDRPRAIQRPNVVCGKAVCVHFAFHTQRAHLDATGILDEYKKLVSSS